jgi:hypothetical protein
MDGSQRVLHRQQSSWIPTAGTLVSITFLPLSFIISLLLSVMSIEHLESSIVPHEKALDLRPGPAYSKQLVDCNCLGKALWARFHHYGRKDDLDRSILLLQEALDGCPKRDTSSGLPSRAPSTCFQ